MVPPAGRREHPLPALWRGGGFAQVRLLEQGERARLEGSPAHEIETYTGPYNATQTYVVYYPELDPSAMEPRDSRLSAAWQIASFGDRGTVQHAECVLRQRHRLRWPDEAALTCEVRGKTLWAWNRAFAVALRDYIASTDRDRSRFPFAAQLMHVPAWFLTAKHRAEAVKKLDRMLASS